MASAGGAVSLRAGIYRRAVAVPVRADARGMRLQQLSDAGRECRWAVYGGVADPAVASTAVYSVGRDYGARGATVVGCGDGFYAGPRDADPAACVEAYWG